MHPLLFEIPLFGGLRIYSYGVLVALAFVAGILWMSHEAKVAKVSNEFVMDLAFYVILGALIGSRVLYIFTDWERYVAHPLDVFKIWEGGLVFYGGFIGALLVGFYYVRKHKESFLKITDLFVPGLAIAHSIGRLGCFAAGCCYGREAFNFPFAVVFPKTIYSLAPAGIPLFPTQLFESITELLIFGILVFIRRRKTFQGQILLSYLMIYSVSRSILETFRGDSVRGFVIPGVISTSQFISILLFISALILYINLRRKNASKALTTKA